MRAHGAQTNPRKRSRRDLDLGELSRGTLLVEERENPFRRRDATTRDQR